MFRPSYGKPFTFQIPFNLDGKNFQQFLGVFPIVQPLVALKPTANQPTNYYPSMKLEGWLNWTEMIEMKGEIYRFCSCKAVLPCVYLTK